jgi:hypothetical protein
MRGGGSPTLLLAAAAAAPADSLIVVSDCKGAVTALSRGKFKAQHDLVKMAREELLAEWDLADDAEHPWRTDNSVTICPLVRRHEVQSAVEPIVITVDGSYTVSN